MLLDSISIGRNFCSYKIYHFFYFLERLLKFWGRPQTFWDSKQKPKIPYWNLGDVPKIVCYLPQNGKSVKNKNFGELLGDINRGFFWHLGTFWGSHVSCDVALTPVNRCLKKNVYVNIFSHFSHPPLTTALSSHVVVVVTHDDTNHHTTRWNSDCWHHWSLKWVHFATNHEERQLYSGWMDVP